MLEKSSWKPQQPQHISSSTLSAASTPADRFTTPVVGLLCETVKLGCLPGLETASKTSSLLGSLVQSTKWSKSWGCGFFFYARGLRFLTFFSPAHHKLLLRPVPDRKKNHKTRPPYESKRVKDHPAHRLIPALKGDFSTLPREECHW